jgi:hypothetical protein
MPTLLAAAGVPDPADVGVPEVIVMERSSAAPRSWRRRALPCAAAQIELQTGLSDKGCLTTPYRIHAADRSAMMMIDSSESWTAARTSVWSSNV